MYVCVYVNHCFDLICFNSVNEEGSFFFDWSMPFVGTCILSVAKHFPPSPLRSAGEGKREPSFMQG
jgi:hypothetical protein